MKKTLFFIGYTLVALLFLGINHLWPSENWGRIASDPILLMFYVVGFIVLGWIFEITWDWGPKKTH